MGALIAIGVVILLIMLGVPVAFSFAAMALVLSIIYEIDISSLMTTGFWSVNSLILVALPLFIMTGYVLKNGGLAQRLIDFVEALVGGSRSGMGSSMVVACGIFGAISGTASAAVAAIGRIMIDPMEERGYDRAYTSSLLGTSALLGLLIPPSITMILYAVVTRQSVVACFLATVGPGLLLMLALIIYNRFYARRLDHGDAPANVAFKEHIRRIGTTGWKALPALMMPVIILGGIYSGQFTPTEAAAIALVYAIPVGFLVYRDLNLRNLSQSIVDAAATTGVIMIILVFSFIASRIFTLERVPQELTALLLDNIKSPVAILIAVNIFLIMLGMVMDDISVIAITSPLLLPVMAGIDVHPVHFAAIIGMSVVIGCNSPPMAPILFLSCRVGAVGMSRVAKPAMSLLLFTALPVQLIVTFFPELALWLPRALGHL